MAFEMGGGDVTNDINDETQARHKRMNLVLVATRSTTTTSLFELASL